MEHLDLTARIVAVGAFVFMLGMGVGYAGKKRHGQAAWMALAALLIFAGIWLCFGWWGFGFAVLIVGLLIAWQVIKELQDEQLAVAAAKLAKASAAAPPPPDSDNVKGGAVTGFPGPKVVK